MLWPLRCSVLSTFVWLCSTALAQPSTDSTLAGLAAAAQLLQTDLSHSQTESILTGLRNKVESVHPGFFRIDSPTLSYFACLLSFFSVSNCSITFLDYSYTKT